MHKRSKLQQRCCLCSLRMRSIHAWRLVLQWQSHQWRAGHPYTPHTLHRKSTLLMFIECCEHKSFMASTHVYCKSLRVTPCKNYRIDNTNSVHNRHPGDSSGNVVDDDPTLNETVNIGIVDGVLIECNQLNDYAFRGQEFLDMTFTEYCLNTYDTPLLARHIAAEIKLASDDRRPGPPPNLRSRYRSCHPASNSHIRVTYKSGHRHMPSFVGASFASATIPAERILYVASMMVLF